jgi:hypothetical protein
MMNLWAVIFTDRRLIEAVQSVMGVPLMLAMYALATRHSNDRVAAVGWASAILLMPGSLLELRSTYIDLHVASLFLASLYFCTVPNMRLRDAALAALCLSMLGGSKGMALTWVPILGFAALLRVCWRHLSRRPLGTVLLVVAALFTIFALGGPFYVRNWLVHQNPLWPISFRSATFDVHWIGNQEAVDMNKPWGQFLTDLFSVPKPGADFHDTRIYGYGLGVPFVVLPVAAAGLCVAAALRFRELVTRKAGSTSAGNVLLVAGLALATAPFSPALWSARYNLHVPAALMLVVCWLSTWFSRRLGEGAVATNVMTALMMMHWAFPGWMVSFEQARELARQPYSQRVTFESAGYATSSKFVAARERELRKGDVVVYPDENYFPATFWNERFSNRVIYVPSRLGPEGFLKRADALSAEWAIVAPSTREYAALAQQKSLWQEIADASIRPRAVAFRRLSK